ncbi:MAG: type II toxin-antitoxin system VapC family toxin [Armatimonadetes bacterium]|nr:type II toxin-antitoxin system VapC family toxin [Armatimonadota bacterium]
MFLIDTNVWLESPLAQERADEVDCFLAGADTETLATTDFALHSIGLILTRLGRADLLSRFVTDIAREPGIRVLTVPPLELPKVPDLSTQFGLDFDDAYQYLAAQVHGCTLISFDAHFDRTDLRRKTPADAATI